MTSSHPQIPQQEYVLFCFYNHWYPFLLYFRGFVATNQAKFWGEISPIDYIHVENEGVAFLIFGKTRYSSLYFVCIIPHDLKRVTLKDTVKEDTDRKQSPHKERCPGKHNRTLAVAREKLLKRNTLTCCSITTCYWKRYLLFWHLRQLQHSKRYCPKEELWLWSRQHLDMPVASHKWPLPMEREKKSRIEKTCENWKGNFRVKFLLSNPCFLCCLSQRIKLCFEGAATKAV